MNRTTGISRIFLLAAVPCISGCSGVKTVQQSTVLRARGVRSWAREQNAQSGVTGIKAISAA